MVLEVMGISIKTNRLTLFLIRKYQVWPSQNLYECGSFQYPEQIVGVMWMSLTLWKTNIFGELSDPLLVWIYRV